MMSKIVAQTALIDQFTKSLIQTQQMIENFIKTEEKEINKKQKFYRDMMFYMKNVPKNT